MLDKQGTDNTMRLRKWMTQGNQAVDNTKEEEMRGGGQLTWVADSCWQQQPTMEHVNK
jgi:hypothetical protein